MRSASGTALFLQDRRSRCLNRPGAAVREFIVLRKVGILAVILGSTVILALVASLVQTSIETHHGPLPGQGWAIVALVPPSSLLIALGIIVGLKELPERGNPGRRRDIAILSVGGAIVALVFLRIVLSMVT